MTAPATGTRELRIPAELCQVSVAREYVAVRARKAGLTERQVFDLKVAVSEACANAIEHSDSREDVVIQTRRRTGRFQVCVCHPGEFRPGHAGRINSHHRGFGLPLMIGLLDEVCVTRLPGGGTRVALSVFL